MKWITVFLFSILCFASNAQKNSIDSLLHSTYPDSLPGISVAIMQNNQLVFTHNYGVANLTNKTPITETTNFNIASLTKQFTALAILQLAEQKKLSLDDKLSRFFPDMNRQVADSITIKQLLTHSSGLTDHYDYVDTKNIQHGHDSDVYKAIKNVSKLYFTPGTTFRYSNTSYCLLALIVERVSGVSYPDYMKTYIFQPAGMKNTIVWNEKERIINEAKGYDRDSATLQFLSSGPSEHIFFSTEGDGGIYTSVSDYMRWLKALNEGKPLSKTITEEARRLQFSIAGEAKIGYGFGWFVDESGDAKKVYHSGDNGGFRTYSFTIPKQGFAIVIFSNRSDISVEDIVEKVYHILYPSQPDFVKIEVLTS